MLRTRVGYCGGGVQDEPPSYNKVCAHADFDQYAEAIQLDFDPAVLSFEDVLDAFFRAHDADRGGNSRQYASVIFAHGEAQRAAAARALEARPRASTTVEDGGEHSFWDAEAYHQKWLLHRKRDLFMCLGMTEHDELLGAPATVLNAVAAGKMSPETAAARLDVLLAGGEVEGATHGSVRAMLDRW